MGASGQWISYWSPVSQWRPCRFCCLLIQTSEPVHLSDCLAEYVINIEKPAVWKVANRTGWAVVSVLMKCSVSRLFRTINNPLPLFEMQHSLLFHQCHV